VAFDRAFCDRRLVGYRRGDVGRDGDRFGIAAPLAGGRGDLLESVVQIRERNIMGEPAITEPADHTSVSRPERGVIDRDVRVDRREVRDAKDLAVVAHSVGLPAGKALEQLDGLVGAPDGSGEVHPV
jgi:hypothetical protein